MCPEKDSKHPSISVLMRDGNAARFKPKYLPCRSEPNAQVGMLRIRGEGGREGRASHRLHSCDLVVAAADKNAAEAIKASRSRNIIKTSSDLLSLN